MNEIKTRNQLKVTLKQTMLLWGPSNKDLLGFNLITHQKKSQKKNKARGQTKAKKDNLNEEKHL